MEKVLRWVAGHPEFRHHIARAKIALRRVGNDLLEPQSLKPESGDNSCRFGGISLAPARMCETPANLDARCDVFERKWMDPEIGWPQPDPSRKRRFSDDLNGPRSPALGSQVRTQSCGIGIALASRKDGRKELPHTWIGVERGVSRKIVIPPLAQE